MSIIRRCAAITLATGMAVGAAAAPASAAPVNNQAGLVNVNIQLNNIDVEIPVSVAAALNICDTNVAVLSIVTETDTFTSCEAFADSEANA